MTAAPAPIIIAPAICAGTPPGTGDSTFQRVSSHGTTPAAVAGAIAKTAVPMPARRRSLAEAGDAVIPAIVTPPR